MSVLLRLASALGRNDEVPNQELAAQLAGSGDAAAVAELAAGAMRGPKPIRHDAIKVLYEIGDRRPELIAPHRDGFVALLQERDNRMIWGALCALDTLARTEPDFIATHLAAILDAADRSSVIAMDRTMSMLAKLAARPGTGRFAWERMMAALRTSAVNQTPMYAEFALAAATANNPAELAEVVRHRLDGIGQPAKRARLEKVLRKLEKL
ncbi:MAG: hypothetical protein KF849_02745 [Rhizobiaceae bacterium]|nr:hypothetical protein [Rhizobiaceae bacterium]